MKMSALLSSDTVRHRARLPVLLSRTCSSFHPLTLDVQYVYTCGPVPRRRWAGHPPFCTYLCKRGQQAQAARAAASCTRTTPFFFYATQRDVSIDLLRAATDTLGRTCYVQHELCKRYFDTVATCINMMGSWPCLIHPDPEIQL